MNVPVLQPVAPSDILSVGGFLGRRFRVNQTGRLKDPLLSEEFIRLHERKNYDEWFWLGEQIGKWLDAAAYSALISHDQALLDRVHELVDRLAASQEESGYLGITRPFHRTPARGMELYEMYYVLHGLLVCHELLGSEAALNTARRLGDYIMQHWGVEPGQFPLVGPFPGNGHDGGEGTLILEPMVLLGMASGDKRYIEWGEATLAKWDEWWEQYPQANHSCGYTAMRQFAAGEKDVFELRENMHAHTFHMTLLGLAALYNATGKQEYRDVVIGSVNRLADEWIFLTGGMSSLERYVPHKYYNARNQIEVCPQHTWILLLDQVLRWTGEQRYIDEIERDLFNHFLAAQLADGTNWSYFTPLNGRAREPESPNCCNAAGHRIAGRMPTYLYALRANAPAVLMYTASAATLRPQGGPAVHLEQRTNYPSDGAVQIEVRPEQDATFALHLAIPPYAQGAMVRVGDATPVTVEAGDFHVIERQWPSSGVTVHLDLPLPLVWRGNDDVAALQRGPLVYAYFQDAQPDTVVFHGRRGLYPGDVQLAADLAQPPVVEEETAPEDQLGPVLRVAGVQLSRPPLFAQAQANAALPAETEQTLVLHPFVNQGAIRGEFGVFLHHTQQS